MLLSNGGPVRYRSSPAHGSDLQSDCQSHWLYRPENGTCGETRTRTGCVLSALPLPLGYAGIKLVDPRGIEPRPLALQASAHTSYARDPWWRYRGSNPGPEACKATALPSELYPHNFIYGAGNRNRTRDLMLTRQLLYRLSYTGVIQLERLFWTGLEPATV